MRRAAPLLVLALLTAALVPSAAAAAAPTQLPDQGLYDACDPVKSADRCQSRLRRMAAAGFKVVQKMGVVQTEEMPYLLQYANDARSLGMKVIWQLRPPIGEADLAVRMAALRLHPATWGWYIYDEPGPADRDVVAAFAASVKRVDPHHPRLIMGCGNCYGGEGSVSFLSGIDATLGTDIYPVHEQAPDQPIVGKRVAAVAAGLQNVADREGRRTVVALQAWRWGDSHYDSEATGLGAASRYPTRKEIEDQRNAALEHSRPDVILWFRMEQVIGWEPGQRPWYWAEPPDAAQRWANLVGGAFAPLPTKPNRTPVARFSMRKAGMSKRAQAARSAARRVRVDAGLSYDPDGRIVRYRWYVSGKRGAACTRRRCSLKLRRGSRRKVKLVVTDDHGARSARARVVRVR